MLRGIAVKAGQWEVLGILFIIVVGSCLHFLFELSGSLPVVGMVGAVNESVWEHLKIGFWPAVFFALIEYSFLKSKANFWMAKATSAYVIPVTIIVLFYVYTTILGYNTLALDITVFIVAVIVGQAASYRVLTYRDLSAQLKWAGIAALLVLAALFMVFTFYPPHVGLFQDPVTGGYGIVS
ncbi:MAG: hypothetical protein HXS52_11800 [Theionarchaea archaeon]|nr:hypothetical protein [Theionarchaea archaeon]MBU7038606.1 hypothetical protein [Theionarchaea archaeon]